MIHQIYVINKDYDFNLIKNGKWKRLTSRHGVILLIAKCTYFLPSERVSYNEEIGTKDVLDYIGTCGWRENYDDKDLLSIYWDISNKAQLIDENMFDSEKHVQIIL